MKTYGFIGVGNMGGALAEAICESTVDKRVLLCDHNCRKVDALASKFKVQAADAQTIARESDYIILGVKPQGLADTVREFSSVAANRRQKPIIVSMAAGVSIQKLTDTLGFETPIFRIMPNIPVSVGMGAILFSVNDLVSASEQDEFQEIMLHAGSLIKIPEKLMDAAGALSGCGPAFVYLFIEALADGAVECGVDRTTALQLAAQTVKGAAETVLQGQHPAVLKDAVCSPGGTTIAGVHALEKGGFRSLTMDAVKASYDKTSTL